MRTANGFMTDQPTDDEWAEAYRIINGPDGSNLPGNVDVEYYERKAENIDGPILEIGCGTGRITLRLAEAGHDVHGIDVSQAYLDVLGETARRRGVEPAVERADMTSFSYDEAFELIIVPYDTFRYNTTVEGQLRTLENVRGHLSDTGRAVFAFSRPEPGWSTTPRTIRSEFSHDGDDYLLLSTLGLADEIEQILEIDEKLYRNGTLVGEHVVELARIYKREFEHLLERTGFVVRDVYDDYEENPLGEGDERKTTVWWVGTSGSGR